MSNHHTHRYTTPLIFLHWLMLAVVMLAYASMELEDIFPRGSAMREETQLWHYVLGMSVLWLVILRLPFGLIVSHRFAANPKNAATTTHTAAVNTSTASIEQIFTHWQARLAKAMHISLYVWMLALPLIGWLLVNARGESIRYFGVELPMLLTHHVGAASILEEVHEAIAGVGYLLIGLHTAAALIHHYILGDM